MGAVIEQRIKMLLKQWPMLLIMTGMGLFLTMIFSGAFTGSATKYTVYISDMDLTSASTQFIAEIKKDNTFNYIEESTDTAIEKIESSNAIGAIIINKDFEESINSFKEPKIQLFVTNESLEVFNIENIIKSSYSSFINEKLLIMGLENTVKSMGKTVTNDFEQGIKRSLEKELEYKKSITTVSTVINSNSSNKNNVKVHYLIGFTLMFSMFTLVFSVGEILEEKKRKTWQRQLISPISNIEILGGNLIAIFLIGVIQITILILSGKYFFDISWGSSIGAVLLIAYAFVLCSTSLGLLLSGLLTSPEQLNSLSPIIIVSTCMLGGCMWPIEMVNSKLLLFLSNIVPQRWAMQGINRIVTYGGGFNEAITPTLVILFMSIILILVGTTLVNSESRI